MIDTENTLKIKQLSQKHPNLLNNYFDKDQRSLPLTRSVWIGSKKITNLLINLGADLNKQVKNGFSPIFYACERGHFDLLNFLLEKKKINIFLEDNFGRNCLDIAVIKGYYNCALVLVKKGLKVKKLGFYQRFKNGFVGVKMDFYWFLESLEELREISDFEANRFIFVKKNKGFREMEKFREFLYGMEKKDVKVERRVVRNIEKIVLKSLKRDKINESFLEINLGEDKIENCLSEKKNSEGSIILNNYNDENFNFGNFAKEKRDREIIKKIKKKKFKNVLKALKQKSSFEEIKKNEENIEKNEENIERNNLKNILEALTVQKSIEEVENKVEEVQIVKNLDDFEILPDDDSFINL